MPTHHQSAARAADADPRSMNTANQRTIIPPPVPARLKGSARANIDDGVKNINLCPVRIRHWIDGAGLPELLAPPANRLFRRIGRASRPDRNFSPLDRNCGAPNPPGRCRIDDPTEAPMKKPLSTQLRLARPGALLASTIGLALAAAAAAQPQIAVDRDHVPILGQGERLTRPAAQAAPAGF